MDGMQIRRFMTGAGLCWMLAFCSFAFAESDNLKPYPLPEAGFTRWVIHLEPLANEELRKVEIIIGKNMEGMSSRPFRSGLPAEP